MNYLDIVLQGIINNRVYLKEYFISQQKIAERDDFIEEKVFFYECRAIIGKLEEEILRQVAQRQHELSMFINSIDGEDKARMESLENQLEDTLPQNFTVNLISFAHGNYSGNLSYKDILNLKLSLQVVSESPKTKTNIENQIIQKRPSKEEHLSEIRKILQPLGGFWNNDPILSKYDIERLQEYAIHINDFGCLPNDVLEFPKTSVTTEFIRKTIHQLYVYLNKQHKEVWVGLVHLFKQFNNTETTTTSSKFSNYSHDYNRDLGTMITY